MDETKRRLLFKVTTDKMLKKILFEKNDFLAQKNIFLPGICVKGHPIRSDTLNAADLLNATRTIKY